MTMTSEPGESLAAAESLAGESASERRKARLAVVYTLGAFVGILVLVGLVGGSPITIINGMLREAVSPQTAAVAIAVIGLNIHFGFTGLLNMGQAGFMLLGAYGFAISISQRRPAARWPS